MASENSCPRCGEAIPADVLFGLCPSCLFHSPEVGEADPNGFPEHIAGYPIRGILGRGGFGVVYLAYQPSVGREVALKIMKCEFMDPDDLARFRREIELLAQLDLINVVPIFDSGIDDGSPYFTMPVMAGGTLRTRLDRFKHPRHAAQLITTLARAVHALHQHPLRVLHRDLKPENILFDLQGNPYISDFGIAKIASHEGWIRATRGLGCPLYVAPEQAFGDDSELTPAVDVYSLGAIFYELLTGSLLTRAGPSRRCCAGSRWRNQSPRGGTSPEWIEISKPSVCMHSSE